MRNTFLFICGLFLAFATFAQQDFQGKLTYKVYLQDTSMHDMFPPERMYIYSQSHLLRIETQSAISGRQIQIRNTEKNKSIMLLDTPKGKFAIQIVDTIPGKKYIVKKGKGKGMFNYYKTKNLNVTNINLNQNFKFSYIPKISAKYVPGFEYFPGLLTKYYVHTIDGIYVYELEKMESYQVPQNLFGVPSDYQIIKMEQFIELFSVDGMEIKG